MINLRNISLAYGKKKLFNGISQVIGPRDRIALVGSNGSGKSTLVQVLMKAVEVDEGEIEKPEQVTIGYLPQDGIAVSGKTLYEEAEAAFGDLLSLREQIEEAEERMADMDTASEEFYDLVDLIGGWEQQLEEHEPEKMKSRISRILSGMGFLENDLNRDAGEFSGGWQMRIAFAKLLLQSPSLIILDEPTNHLDVVSQHWVEQYLKHYQGALVIISHDRAFLDVVTDRTLELKLGKMNSYKGNYSFYEKESLARKEQLRKAYDNQRKEIQRQKDFINRFRSNVKKASMVQSRIKALEKMELVEREPEEKKIYLRFPPSPPASNRVVTIEGLCKSYDENVIFDGLDLRIEKGERMAIVGVNGAGKSTLARILAGVEPHQEGEIKLGINTVIGYFAQQQAEELDPANTVLQEVEAVVEEGSGANARGALGALLFSGDDVFKSTKVLSGGERNRVALAKLLMRPCNCLILDEPTNHLDIQSKEVLQKAINEFEGSVIIVSHDRFFLDGIVDNVLEVSREGTRMLNGNVTEYVARMEKEKKRR